MIYEVAMPSQICIKLFIRKYTVFKAAYLLFLHMTISRPIKR